jgi:hypothetical protein
VGPEAIPIGIAVIVERQIIANYYNVVSRMPVTGRIQIAANPSFGYRLRNAAARI